MSPLSANIGTTVSSYALLWKLIWKRWALRILYFIHTCIEFSRWIFKVSHASLSEEIVEHCLALAWSFADDSDSSGWILPSAFRNRFVRCICINKIIHFSDSPKNLHNCRFSLQLNPFGCGNASGDMVESFLVNMDFGRCAKTRVMTFLCYVLALSFLICKILMYVKVCEGI